MDGPKGGQAPPQGKKNKKKNLGLPNPKEKKIFLMVIYIYIYIYLFISRVVPHSSKNLDSLSFN